MRGNVRAQPSVAFRCDFFADFFTRALLFSTSSFLIFPSTVDVSFSCVLRAPFSHLGKAVVVDAEAPCYILLLSNEKKDRRKAKRLLLSTSGCFFVVILSNTPLHMVLKTKYKNKNKNKICSILFTSFPIYCFFTMRLNQSEDFRSRL